MNARRFIVFMDKAGILLRRRTGWNMTDTRLMHRAAALALVLLMGASPAAMAQSAVVDNGSDPQSRLNLREQPDKGSASLGRFYSGTPVEIVADAGGGWSQVAIGTAESPIGGYMMTAYLAADSTTDATLERSVVSPYGTPSVVLRDQPSNSYDAVAMLRVGETVRVLGDSGEYYYVMTQSEAVGCLCSDELSSK